MKNSILLFVSLLFYTITFAQNSIPGIYVLQFSDKGVNSDAVFNPSLYLSEKAVERRIKHKIAFDQYDMPVDEHYVSEVSKTGARILARSRWLNTIVIETTNDVADKISAMPFITNIQLIDNQSKNSKTSSKPFFKEEKTYPGVAGNTKKKVTTDIYDYGIAFNQIDQLKGQYLHNSGFSGQGMTIAVIDAGFNSVDIMPCFDSLRANNQIKGTRDFAVPGNNVYGTDMFFHGTSVLSCMGSYVSGQMIGTAPKADYWLLRSEVAESESIIEEYYWVSAAEFADSVGADLINSSLGYTTFDNPATNHTYADMDGNTTVVTIGADKAAEKGILVVNSAGNSGSTTDPWKYIGAPADGDSVFTIGAVDGSGNRASFSSLGPTYDGRIKPTVSAQGQGSAIYIPNYPNPPVLSYGNGTSFSSPITCGITACLWQALPDLNNMQIIEAIKATASQASEPDSLLGWGIPNYEKAYTTLAVNIQPVEKQLYTYPNPVSDHLTIVLPISFTGKFRVEFIDLSGRTVYSQQGSENSIRSLQINDISKIPSGTYLVRMSSNTSTYLCKIIKE
jgi:serine protease AprX